MFHDFSFLFMGTSKNSNLNNSCSMFSIGCGTKF
jgi:hypothetical protein